MIQNKQKNWFTGLILASAFAPVWTQSASADTAKDQSSSAAAVEPDNSKHNEADNKTTRPTAEEQGKADTDQQLTKNIRQALVQDDTLSTYGHNVKIIARGGKVTLRGPVKSESERQKIQEKAVTIAGADHVVNQLKVKQ